MLMLLWQANACKPVVVWSTITTHQLWVGACAVGRVAGTHIVALVRGSAGDGVAAMAHATRAGVRLGAGVAVIAGRAVCLG